LESSLPKPVANGDSLPYWNGARAQKLLIRKCQDCGELHFMPRLLCPTCWSENLEWVEAKGKGTIHSFTIIRRASSADFASQVPYVVALIDLEEGPRMLTNILGKDALSASIGDSVQVTFEDRGDGAMIPQFGRVLAEGAI
jgi:uncharacterized OB-fold protein